MTIPRLPGWGEELGAILPQLGQSLAHLANPNLDNENMLKQAIAQNPGLLAELANNEANNPGALKSLGFGRVADTVSRMSPTPEAKLKTAISQNTLDAIKNNPSLARDAGYRNVLGETPTDTKLKDQNLEKGKTELELAPTLKATHIANLANINNETKKGELANTRRGLAQDYLASPEGKKKNVRQIAIDIVNGGRIRPEVAAGLMESNPAIKEAIDKIKDEDRIGAEREFINLRNTANKQDVVERYRAATASRIYDELDTSDFTFDDYYNHINGKGSTETPEMKAKIEQAMMKMKGDKKEKILNAIRNSLTNAQNEARLAYKDADKRGDKPEAIAGQLRTSAIAIQTALDQLEPLTGKKYNVQFTDKIPKTENFLGFGDQYGITLTDEDGKPVKLESIGRDSKLANLDMMAQDLKKNPKIKDDPFFKEAWETLTKEQQDSVTSLAGEKKDSSVTTNTKPVPSKDKAKLPPSPERESKGFSPFSFPFSPVSTGPSKNKEPEKKEVLKPKEEEKLTEPEILTSLDSIQLGLSTADSVKKMAKADSIAEVNKLYELAKAYVASGEKSSSYPIRELFTTRRVQAFNDMIKTLKGSRK